jgi:GAF domain-containing protein
VLEDPEYVPRNTAMTAGFRSVMSVPLLRDGNPIGAISVGRPDPGAFPDEQIALLRTFADQAVIAIENVRLFTELEIRNRDLTEALEQQTATSDILRVISSSQTDVQPVFETIVSSVRSLCDATFSGVYLLDGEMLSLAASDGMTLDERKAFAAGYPRKIGPDTVSGRAALECRVVQTPDLISDPAYSSAPGTRVGARTVLGVPLMRDSRAIGSIGVWRAEVKPFSETQIALLQTFADQAVIAIENVRLFKELETRNRALTEALEQQTATSEILRVISQSQTDAQPVFDTIAHPSTSCASQRRGVFTFDGELVHLVASVIGIPATSR